jgi:hypothetical protein
LGNMEYGTYVTLIAYLVSGLGCGLGLVCRIRRGSAPVLPITVG